MRIQFQSINIVSHKLKTWLEVLHFKPVSINFFVTQYLLYYSIYNINEKFLVLRLVRDRPKNVFHLTCLFLYYLFINTLNCIHLLFFAINLIIFFSMLENFENFIRRSNIFPSLKKYLKQLK